MWPQFERWWHNASWLESIALIGTCWWEVSVLHLLVISVYCPHTNEAITTQFYHAHNSLAPIRPLWIRKTYNGNILLVLSLAIIWWARSRYKNNNLPGKLLQTRYQFAAHQLLRNVTEEVPESRCCYWGWWRTYPRNIWRNNNVVITSKPRHFDVSVFKIITTVWFQ